MSDRGPDGTPLLDSNPEDERHREFHCVHCKKLTEDGFHIELAEGERGGPAKEAFLCDDCMEKREDTWGNDELVNGMEGICDIVDVSNYLEPGLRVERATAAVMRLHEKAAALDAYMAVAGKAGMLMQANLEENPYHFLEPGPESHCREASWKSPTYMPTRNLVKAMADDPMRWERDQLLKRAKETEQCLRNLYSERKSHKKYGGWERNLWAIPGLEALLKKTTEELGAIILKRPDLM